ncbi:MAG: ribonuclease HII [Pseudomonadota bacterium]
MSKAENAPNRSKKRRPARPDFKSERAAQRAILEAATQGGDGQAKPALIIGVDEVGRGPLAGPVVAAAVWLSEDAARRLAAEGLDDSKRLTPLRRAALLARLDELSRLGRLRGAVGAASPQEIEQLNILWASHLAMRRAVRRLRARLLAQRGVGPAHALIDGDRAPEGLPCPAQALVGGDGRSLSIAAAALLAKQTRDRLMRRLSVRYPAYGWESNAGYAAAAHREAILRDGLSPHHRRGFCRRLMETRAAAGATP